MRLVIRLDASYGNSHARWRPCSRPSSSSSSSGGTPEWPKKIVREHPLQWQRHTHNLLVRTKAALFAGTKLVAAHTREMVEKIITVPAFLVRGGNALRLQLPAVGVLASELREARCPTTVQLPLPHPSL
ncbi:MAG TPA: hypothetical protein VKF14_12095 [Candidatus Dormibacteraeota bacterium]|nr:hypothetical protein [Candidatus Dormibacteraeota bacterium]